MELLPETYGQAHQMTITPGPDVNAEELGHWYSPARVAILIEVEREACAVICEDRFVGSCANAIRKRSKMEG